MLGEVVVLLEGTRVVDRYGAEQVRWDSPTETPVTTLAPPEPRPSEEPTTDARNAVTSGFTLYLPSAAAVTPASRVRVRGEVYEVAGEPALWRSGLSGRPVGLVVQTQRVEG